jgi:hypothetical protein
MSVDDILNQYPEAKPLAHLIKASTEEEFAQAAAEISRSLKAASQPAEPTRLTVAERKAKATKEGNLNAFLHALADEQGVPFTPPLLNGTAGG